MNARNYTVSCHECGKEFAAVRPIDKFCSAICRDRARSKTQKRKEWKKEYVKTGKPYEASRKWASKNKEHVLQLNYDWKKRNPDRAALIAFKARLKSEFHLTVEQYEELMEKQGYCCAICGKHESLFGRRLALDVDHRTGELRAGLCYNCNRNLIGHHTDPELFRKAAEYLDGPFTGIFVAERHYKKKRKRKAS